MRDFKGMKRQRGRNRSGSSGNKPPQQNANRAFDSSGPEGIKVRGNAQHVFEKYQQLARDAAGSGDRVLAENYLQHAEHYFRVIRAVTPGRPVSDIVGRDAFVSGNDIDFEDESGAQAQAYVEQAAEPEQQQQHNQNNNGGDQPRQDYRQDRQDNGGGGYRQDGGQNRDFNNQRPREDRPRYQNDRPRDDRPRDDRPRDDRPRDDRPREDRYQNDRPREDRPREDRPRDDRPRDDRPRDDRPRDDKPREDRPREDRPRDDRPPREDRPRFRDRNREDRPREDRADPMAVVEPQAVPLAVAPAPREDPPLFKGHDSEMPAFLKPREPRAPKAAPVAKAAPDAEAKPKRKRAVKAESEG